MRQWKLSPTDLASLDRWDDYTDAKEAMFFYTDTADAPWTVIKSNDKKRARLQAMRYLLTRFEYEEKDHEVVGSTDPQLVGRASQLFEDDEPHTDPSPVAAREVVEAIASAPTPYRDAVIAVDFVGLSYREAASSLKTGEATITSRLHRGRLHVVRALAGAA